MLPHTIWGYEETFSNLDQRCFIFCREKPSYEFVKNCAPNANVFLAHDLAFMWDVNETREEIRGRRLIDMIEFLRHFRSNIRHEKQVGKQIRDAASASCHQPYTLNAFRTDAYEKTTIELPDDNIDVSEIFSNWDMSPVKSLHATYRMMQFIGQFHIVNTNRLHVAIMSAKLGLRVVFRQ